MIPNTPTKIVSVEFCARNAFWPELIYGINNSTILGTFFQDISRTEIKRYEDNKGSEEKNDLNIHLNISMIRAPPKFGNRSFVIIESRFPTM